MNEIFEFETRVYYADTDAGGIVYHSNYLNFCERARTELLRAKGIVQSKLISDFGISFVVKSIKIDFNRPAKLDDLLTIRTQIIESSSIILKMKQNIFNTKGENIIEAKVEIVCLNKNSKPVRIPKTICDTIFI
jgi:acyl-CoA thioester hydrolase